MKLLADFHTHTKNSRFFHGKNSIEEMAMAANEIGLKEIGITDHGFKHLFCTNKEKLFKAREIVDEINSWSKTKVLLGIEADIISEDGTIDIDNETLSVIDILLVGYHRLIKTDFAGIWGGQGKVDATQKATNAFLNAIEKYPITIIVHPNSIIKTDLYKIGCACRDKGVMIELSSRHMNLSENDIEDLIASGCMFVVSSDAHSREEIANVDKVFELIKKYNIPSELVANVHFEEHERSEQDKELDIYYGIYKERQEEKERKKKELEEQRKIEFSNSLSNEMEEALLKIAKDKGLEYMGKVQENEDNDELVYNDFDADELIRQAEEYIAKLESDDNKNNAVQSELAENSAVEENVFDKEDIKENFALNQNNLKNDLKNESSNDFEEEKNDNIVEPNLEQNENKELDVEEKPAENVETKADAKEINKKQTKTFNKKEFGSIASILEATKDSKSSSKK